MSIPGPRRHGRPAPVDVGIVPATRSLIGSSSTKMGVVGRCTRRNVDTKHISRVDDRRAASSGIVKYALRRRVVVQRGVAD